ncbi:acetyl-CoA synthetase-like protein, partial [Periconia macrospinosa]
MKPNSPTTLGNLDMLTPEDRQQLWAWNSDVPPAVDRCIHDLFADQARARPDAPAICAWDGEMTYGELDELSSRLAAHLVAIGVQPEDVVPLCFEKSMWTVVAMLAVLKAGGAFAPLDPEHPASRHEEIFRQTRARVVLASEQRSTCWGNSGLHVVAVSEKSISQLPNGADEMDLTTKPSNAAYAIFTSGSTGVPKGVVLEHRAVATGCLGHGRALGFAPHTRALQFATYTFDACIVEIVTTLVYGGCVCVPSERERRDSLANAIKAMDANWAFLTPSIAQLLDPVAVSSLRILVLGGEQVRIDDWKRWEGRLQVMNGYGPAECCICSCVFSGLQEFKSGLIGKSVASVGWAVDPDNHNRLAPLGSVGELLVEGPILARGYLGDPEKTAAAFINDPAWLLEGCGQHAGRRGRLYKTGDLVRYDADGNLVYVGRKDGQVKVRGQRVELGEIEHHVRECMPGVTQMAVDAIAPGGEKDKAIVAAFVQLEEEASAEDGPSARVFFPAEVDSQLGERLPGHMVPDIYFAVAQLPMTTSGKTDRKRLREIGASFSAQQLAELRTRSQGPKRRPSTEREKALQRLWAQVLNVQPESIGLDDNFFRLGGDSIVAMKLVAVARVIGFQMTVSDIFHHDTLAKLS